MAEQAPPTLDGGILLTFLFSIGMAGWVFAVFFVIRKRLPYVYFPRELKSKIQYSYYKWFFPTMVESETKMLKKGGLVSILYMEWKELCAISLAFLCIITIPILIPIYVLNTSQTYFAATAASALDPNDPLHWVTFSVSVVTALYLFVLILVYRYYYYLQKKKFLVKLSGDRRSLHVYASQITGIDCSIYEPCDVLNEILKYNPNLPVSRVKKITVAWNYDKLYDLQVDRKKLEKRLNMIETIRLNDPSYDHYAHYIRPNRFGLPGWMTCSARVDKKIFYENKLNIITEKIRKCQMKLKENPSKYHSTTIFILFDSYKANIDFKHHFNSPKYRFLPFLNKWKIQSTNNPKDILWKNLKHKGYIGIIPNLIGCSIMVVLAFALAIPIAFLSQLNNIALIPGIGIGIYHVLVLSPWLMSFLESLLPSLLQMLLFSFIPSIAYFLSKFEKHHSRSSTSASAMIKMWIFYILNGFVFLILLMGGIDIAQSLSTFFNSNSISDAFFDLNYSLYGSYYCNYFIAQIFVGGATKIICFMSLITKNYLRFKWRHFPSIRDYKINRGDEFDYFDQFAQEAFFISICILFVPIVPLVTACAFVFYCTNYMNDKISIMLISKHQYGYAKLINRFLAFQIPSIILIYIFWIFFFLVRGPRIIGYIAAVFYGTLLILFIISIIFCNRIFKRMTYQLNFTELKSYSYMVNARGSVRLIEDEEIDDDDDDVDDNQGGNARGLNNAKSDDWENADPEDSVELIDPSILVTHRDYKLGNAFDPIDENDVSPFMFPGMAPLQ